MCELVDATGGLFGEEATYIVNSKYKNLLADKKYDGHVEDFTNTPINVVQSNGGANSVMIVLSKQNADAF